MMTLREQNETRAGAVIVALVFVVLRGFAALAVDAGMLYAVKAQRQSASDVTAVGCAKSIADPDCSAISLLAAGLASGNINNGLSTVRSSILDATNRVVMVTGGARKAGGNLVKGFVAFHVTGYRFSGFSWSTGGAVNEAVVGQFRQIRHSFRRLRSRPLPGYGTSVVRLSQWA